MNAGMILMLPFAFRKVMFDKLLFKLFCEVIHTTVLLSVMFCKVLLCEVIKPIPELFIPKVRIVLFATKFPFWFVPVIWKRIPVLLALPDVVIVKFVIVLLYEVLWIETP